MQRFKKRLVWGEVSMEKKEIMKKAVAVKYDPQEYSPRVIAKGQGYVAEKLLAKAQSHGVQTYKDAALLEELTKIELGDNIPSELYHAVAQVLVFIDNLDREAGKGLRYV